MMQAVLLGQQFEMQKVWTGDYRATGTFHTLVISGTHVAIVAAFLFFVLRVCFVPASLAGALTAVVAWLYALVTDRKSTRLNSSHRCISYAVFCLKKKRR